MKVRIALFSVILLLGASSCTQAQTADKTGSKSETADHAGTAVAKNVNVSEFAEKIASFDNEIILDVRTPGEWAQGVIEGAVKINVNSSDFKAKVEKQLDKNVPVMVYCRSGNRSGRAMKMLADLGFKEIYNLQGGVTAWASKGQPLVK